MTEAGPKYLTDLTSFRFSDILIFRNLYRTYRNMTQIQTTAIIRKRGQLTIPDSIRKVRQWASKDSVVLVSTDNPDEIVIRPHVSVTKKYDWDKIWAAIKKSRSIKGKNKISSSEFIAQDRLSH